MHIFFLSKQNSRVQHFRVAPPKRIDIFQLINSTLVLLQWETKFAIISTVNPNKQTKSGAKKEFLKQIVPKAEVYRKKFATGTGSDPRKDELFLKDN